MTRVLSAFVLFVALALAGEALAGDRKLKELMEKSGLWEQVGQYGALMRKGIDEQHAQGGSQAMTEDQLRALRRAVLKAFDPDHTRQEVMKVIGEKLPVADEDVLIAWLSSPLGVRLTAIETKYGDPKQIADFTERMRAVTKHVETVKPERLKVLKRMALATRASEAATSIMVNMTVGIAYGVAASMPPQDFTHVTALRKQLESQRLEMAAAMADHTAAEFAYMYRSVSDEDLGRYAAFVETPAARRLSAAAVKALDVVFSQGSVRLGLEMGANVGRGEQRGS